MIMKKKVPAPFQPLSERQKGILGSLMQAKISRRREYLVLDQITQLNTNTLLGTQRTYCNCDFKGSPLAVPDGSSPHQKVCFSLWSAAACVQIWPVWL